MGISPLVFSGVSTFSDDFQAIVDRTVRIASLPLQVLQGDQAEVVARKGAAAGLRDAVEVFAQSLESLGKAVATQGLTVTSSSPKVAVSLRDGASAGTFQISDITSLATRASSTTLLGQASASTGDISGSGNALELVVGSLVQPIVLSDGADNLAGIRDAINAARAGVTATILNTGDPATPYYLSISADSAGAGAIELRTEAGNAASNLLRTITAGSDASLNVNGLTITSHANTLERVVPGVVFTLNATTDAGEVINLGVSSIRSPMVNVLNGFVKAYNALVHKLDAQTGEGAGILQGDSILYDIRSRLNRVSAFSRPSGSVRSFADLGLTFASDGQLSFDAEVVKGMGESSLWEAYAFLGASTGGLGGLATDFSEISDPVSGLIQMQMEGYDRTDTRLSAQIAATSERITSIQSALLARLQAADALLAVLESQQKMIDASLQSLQLVLYGKKEQ